MLSRIELDDVISDYLLTYFIGEFENVALFSKPALLESYAGSPSTSTVLLLLLDILIF